MIVAFEGWNDAGEAATTAVEYLAEQWAAHPFARIEPEDFYDFTLTRPQVRIVDGEQRVVEWPQNGFLHAKPVGAPDLVLLSGVEPQLKWKTFCAQVIEVASVLRVRLVLSLGALLADVPHTRPTSVFGTAYDPKRKLNYSMTISTAKDKLDTRGCIVGGLICKTVSWTRLP